MAGKQLAYIRYGVRKLRHSLTHYVVSLPVIPGSATAGNELQMRSIETAISGEAQASCHSNQLSVAPLRGFSKSTRSMNPFHRMCHVELYKPSTSCMVCFYIRYNAHTLSDTYRPTLYDSCLKTNMIFLLQLSQMLTDFPNSFTDTFLRKCIINVSKLSTSP